MILCGRSCKQFLNQHFLCRSIFSVDLQTYTLQTLRTRISCEDREDGLHSSPDQPLHYPKYITCDNGRRIDEGRCPTDAVWGVQSFPYNGTCVQLFAVPKDFNPYGELPSCNGTVDGDYQFPAGYCLGYYKCEGGVATAVKCPNNAIFDTARKRCEVGGNCIRPT